MTSRVRSLVTLTAVCLFILSTVPVAAGQAGPRFEVSFAAAVRAEPLTGRLLVALASKPAPEPRLAVGFTGVPVFAVDIGQLKPGATAVVDGKALGYPIMNMKDLPPGDYIAQAVVIVYTECKRSDGHTVWVNMSQAQVLLTQAPGNLYSDIQPVKIGPNAGGVVRLELSKVIPAFPEPVDTEWLKHVKMQSRLLTEFWGHPVYIGATVLLPKGYDTHPGSYYPAVYVHEHGVPFMFKTDPSTQEKEMAGARSANLQTGYEFYQSWTSDGFPRVIGITFRQPTPFFPSSYSVNSANVGPYGDALLQEMIPFLEQKFRIIAKPYARLVEGASTGGWESLALQLYHPDFFGGAWVFNPDPIDFHRWQLIDIYEDESAFLLPGSTELYRFERPFRRTVDGQPLTTQRAMSLFEEVLGTRGRAGGQITAWEAIYGPVGSDGYPVPLWDKLTGKINREVASYMRDHGYDLRAYAEKNWPTLGPKLIGKLNFFNGDMDNFYLNLAVYRFQDFLKNTKDPHYEGRFEFGRPMKGHNWHLTDWAGMLREMAEHIKKNAPAGEDPLGWNY